MSDMMLDLARKIAALEARLSRLETKEQVFNNGNVNEGLNADSVDGYHVDTTGAADSHVIGTPSSGIATINGVKSLTDLYAYGDTAGLQARLDSAIVGGQRFDGASLPSGWGWAASPFVTPSVSWGVQYASCVYAYMGANARAFLYKAFPGGTPYFYIRGYPNGLSVGFSVGIRVDDGTDNNFTETLLRITQAAEPTILSYILRTRAAGGTVTEVTRGVLDGSFIPIIAVQWGGTAKPYSSVSWVRMGSTVIMRHLGSLSGYNWTPTRYGVTFTGGTASGGWEGGACDFIYPA